MKRKWMNRLAVLALLLACIPLLAGCASTETATEPENGTVVEPVTEVVNVSSQEAYTLIQENVDNPDFIIVDVRTPDEYDSGHVEGAVNIDYNSGVFREEIDKLDKDREYLVYCRSGSRSSSAVKVMEELGFTVIHHMVGGIIGWNSEGLPLAR